ncbi:MAG: hypothetical protein RMJ87_00440 [Cytophagales bacterium]|nr:TTC39/IML2 family protein [Bernardetiaceae bacterium]MDW8203468.1 hypothetical protein [Cytophagales bacterium]
MRIKVQFFARSIQVMLSFFCLLASLSAISRLFALPVQPYFRFETTEQQAYWQLLNMRFANARVAIQQIPEQNLIRIYLENWADVLEMIGNQDEGLYLSKLSLREERLRRLQQGNPQSPYHLFLQAEVRLQWALAQVVFDEPLAAAWNIRKAFHLLQANSQLYPEFEGNHKSLGILQVLFGAVPAQYEWLLSLWGLSGSTAKGFAMLTNVATGNSVYAPEAQLWLVLLKSQLESTPILQVSNSPHQPGKWLLATAYRKIGNSSMALRLLQDLPTDAPSLLCWEKATALLNSGHYREALQWLELFENKHKGADLLKDAQLKRFWCYWLQNCNEEAMVALQKVTRAGRTRTEADKHAAYWAALRPLPDRRLLQARLLTDGGYVESAGEVLQAINPQTLSLPDLCEYYYRLARNAHRAGNWSQAIAYYETCLVKARGAAFYFLPSAALQAGIISKHYQKDLSKARYYLHRALEYRQHPYKKSIDRKAKEILTTLSKQ